MNDICRFCLSVSSKTMFTLYKDCDILMKISSLCIQVTLDNNLPNQACLPCIEKLKEMCELRKKILDNEEKLKYLNRRDDINNFYCNLRNSSNNKLELVENKENESMNLIDHCSEPNVKCEPSVSEVIKQEIEIYGCNEDNTDDILGISEENTKEEQSSILNMNNCNTDCSRIDNKKFKCLTCFVLLDSQNDLLNHYKDQHQEPHCHINVAKYFKDKTLPDGNIMYECIKCDKKYNNSRAVKRHVKSHIETRPFVCGICGRMYKTASEIIRHDRAHSTSKLTCSYHCGYATAYYGALKEHEKRHRTEFKYTCATCSKGFQVKTWYEQHQNVHNGLKPFVCDVCGLAFHMSRFDNCNTCTIKDRGKESCSWVSKSVRRKALNKGGATIARGYLSAHRSTVHPQASNVKRYVCVYCSLPYNNKKALTNHLKEHGIIKSYLCDICGKSLSNAERLKFHKRVHLGVKPFCCSTCNKSFTKKFNLQIHERTHTGEKLYVCGKCGKRYSQRSALVRHNIRHHNDTSYKCLKCQKNFDSPKQMKSHEKTCL